MADLNNTIVRGKLRVTEDINANGNITTNGNITGNGSGLTNLNASNIGSGTLSADRLATSGVTATSYGPSADAKPGYGETFSVPYITVDNKGRITKASTQTITIPATDNTWRGIQNNLTSDSTTDSLSAKQGKELKKLVDSKSDSGHTHNYAGSSSTGGIANSAKELGTLFYKASEAAGAEGYYKIATITHKTWSYCSFTMFTTNSYSGAKFNTLFDVRCSDNAESLNGFAFNIIGGTDISNKLKYLETKSGNNITKIEIFMQCSRYEHPKFYLVTSSISNGLALNTIDWGDTPDKASSTAMTGSATNTIKAAALTASAGSATKPIYFNNGIPTECNYALEKAVPSDAVFTDTKNTAGATNSEEKLYLVGAKTQEANPQTFSNSSIYMGAAGTLTASALSTNTIELPNGYLSLKFIDGDNMYSAADFSYSSIGGAYLNIDGHLLVNEAGGHANKPDNKTGLSSVGYADYFDTGITISGTVSGSGQWYKLSFPGKTGTFLLDSDLIPETYAYPVFRPGDQNTEPSADNNAFLIIDQSSLGMPNADDRLEIRGFTGTYGSATKPVYFSNGLLTECQTYAGGTKLTINGTSYAGSSQTIYAPTNAISTNTAKRYLLGSSSTTSMVTTNTNSSCYMQSGNIYATAFYASSDKRLKENIKDLDLNCLYLINNINLREFSWKNDNEHKPTVGVIAQELRQVLPEKYAHEFIGGEETEDEYLSVNDSKLVYLLVGAIQEQQKEIESLKAKIDSKIV